MEINYTKVPNQLLDIIADNKQPNYLKSVAGFLLRNINGYDKTPYRIYSISEIAKKTGIKKRTCIYDSLEILSKKELIIYEKIFKGKQVKGYKFYPLFNKGQCNPQVTESVTHRLQQCNPQVTVSPSETSENKEVPEPVNTSSFKYNLKKTQKQKSLDTNTSPEKTPPEVLACVGESEKSFEEIEAEVFNKLPKKAKEAV